MKLTALILLSMFVSYFHAFSQKNISDIQGTVKVGDGTSMKTTEVSIQEWIMFMVDNDFDSTLFPKIDLLSSPVQLLFLDLKNQKDFEYLKISKLKDFRELGKLKDVSQTKKFHKDSKEEFRGLTLRIPITAISYTQATRYCSWLESRITSNSKMNVKIDLPSASIYKMVNSNFDSLNYKGCALFNFINCQCISNTKKNYNEHLGKSLVRADAYFPTESGLYTLQGNAAEMTTMEGTAMGGSFRHYAWQSYSNQTQYYSGPEDWLGFRYVVIWK
jgi:hypothetical protein